MSLQEILRNTPPDTPLYSPAFGPCRLVTACSALTPGKPILVKSCITVGNGPLVNGIDKCNATFSVSSEGKLTPEGECLLFPSQKMRNWQKFQWKRGDVLHYNNVKCIFSRWLADDYTTFEAVYCTAEGMFGAYETSSWSKVANPSVIDDYLRQLEAKHGGKLNPETLEIEKPKPEFNDGDILHIESLHCHYIFIKKGDDQGENLTMYHALMVKDEVDDVAEAVEDKDSSLRICRAEDVKNLRPATPDERLRLFDALAKDGKAWDAEKRQIVSIHKQPEFKPFDHVLVRDDDDDEWRAAIYFGIEEDDPNYPYRRWPLLPIAGASVSPTTATSAFSEQPTRRTDIMVKVEIRLCAAERDNILFRWVSPKELAFLQALEKGDWAFKGASPQLQITIIGKYL